MRTIIISNRDEKNDRVKTCYLYHTNTCYHTNPSPRTVAPRELDVFNPCYYQHRHHEHAATTNLLVINKRVFSYKPMSPCSLTGKLMTLLLRFISSKKKSISETLFLKLKFGTWYLDIQRKKKKHLSAAQFGFCTSNTCKVTRPWLLGLAVWPW